MRFFAVFRKCAREQKRDLWVLALSVAFTPLFVLVYWLFIGGNATTSYAVAVVNLDHGAILADGTLLQAGADTVQAMEDLTFKDGSPILRVKPVPDRLVGEVKLRERGAALLVILPADFSAVLAQARAGDALRTTDIEFVGDLTNPYYTVAAVMAMTAIDGYATAATGDYRPVELVETPLGGSAARTEFEIYIPGLFVLAVIMMMFQAAMAVAREIESGTLQRLRISRLAAWEFVGGTTAWLVLIAIVEVLVAFGAAVAFGFRSQGALWIAILVGIITSFSVIGVGMVVASFSKTVSQAFVVANFPFGFFMLLSGAAFPVPMGRWFTFLGHDFNFADLLPPTHAVAALNKVFTLGDGVGEIGFELVALGLLSVLYFGIGVWLFRKLHLQ
jgi:ABC-2 type transport system permease protein